MANSRPRLAVPVAIIAALVLALMAIAPALAAPSSGASGSSRTLASHVSDCNVSFDAGGNLLLDGVALTAAQLAILDPLLLADVSLAAALELAADADADACVNLVIDLIGLTAVINADISVCGTVVFGATTVSVGGAVISADLLTAELINILDAAAAAGAEACVAVTVTDNEVVVDVSVELCVSVTLLDTGALSVDIGGTEFIFDGTLIDAGALLDVGVTAQVSLLIAGTLDITADTIELSIVVTECAAVPTPTPTATPSTGATATPVPTASLLPNTGLASNEPSGGMIVATLFALVALASASVLGYRTMVRRTR